MESPAGTLKTLDSVTSARSFGGVFSVLGIATIRGSAGVLGGCDHLCETFQFKKFVRESLLYLIEERKSLEYKAQIGSQNVCYIFHYPDQGKYITSSLTLTHTALYS